VFVTAVVVVMMIVMGVNVTAIETAVVVFEAAGVGLIADVMGII
jgi:rRNA processing protein Gar1